MLSLANTKKKKKRWGKWAQETAFLVQKRLWTKVLPLCRRWITRNDGDHACSRETDWSPAPQHHLLQQMHKGCFTNSYADGSVSPRDVGRGVKCQSLSAGRHSRARPNSASDCYLQPALNKFPDALPRSLHKQRQRGMRGERC